MPAVSVVLPAFNAVSTIFRAVRSILYQAFSNLECIVVDDGSTDGTAEVLSDMCDDRLQVLSLPHQGVASAMNAGVRLARAPLIARMDADDYSHRHRLQKQIEYLHECGVDVTGCQVHILNGKGSPVMSMRRYEHWINHETPNHEMIMALRFVELPIVNPTILAKRSYFELECRSDDFPEDYDLMLRAASAGLRFGKVPEKLLDWVDSTGRLTRSDVRYTDAAFMQCRRYHLRNGPLHDVRQVDLWGLGKTGKPWLRWLKDQGFTVRQAYEVDSRKVGKKIQGVPVLPPEQLPTADGTPLIVAVGAAGARELIRQHIQPHGYKMGQDTWFVA